MKNVLLITLLICCASLAQAQNLKKFTPKQLHQDLDSLVAYLEEVHPDLYSKYSRKKFYSQVLQTKRSITRNLNLLEFYALSAPLLGKLEDGHIDFKIMTIYNSMNPYVLPHHFKFVIDKHYIEYIGPHSGFSAVIPVKAKITHINGIPAKRIIQDIIDRITGENKEFRAEYGSNKLDMFLDILYHIQGEYVLDYEYSGKKSRSVLKGIRKQDIDLLAKQKSESLVQESCYRFYFEQDSVGVMEIKCLDWNGLKTFIDSSFAFIKQRGVDNLIINLIDNGGGDSDVGDEFLNYLLEQPYKQYDKILSKNSRFVKKRLVNQLAGKNPSKGQQAFLNKINGTIDTLILDSVIPKKDLPLRYKGQLFVLVNKQTYSSAADLAQCIKYYGRGLIVGEETGGMIKSFGDIVTVALPNSKLEAVVSSKLYYNVGAKDNQWTGVVPDVSVSKQDAVNEAIRQMQKRRNRGNSSLR